MITKPTVQKTILYLPIEMVSSIMKEAAENGSMRYSDRIESRISEVVRELGNLKDYTELKSKYTETIATFKPAKRGRPSGKSEVLKKSINAYFTQTTIKNISKYAKRFELSKSSFVELALCISDKIYGIPLNKNQGIKMDASDYDLLKTVMESTGAKAVYEFLSACQRTWIIKEIKKEIKENRGEGIN